MRSPPARRRRPCASGRRPPRAGGRSRWSPSRRAARRSRSAGRRRKRAGTSASRTVARRGARTGWPAAIAIMSRPMPTISRNDQNTSGTYGRSSARQLLQALDCAVRGRGSGSGCRASGSRSRSGWPRLPGRAARTGSAGRPPRGLPVALHGSDLRGLVLERIQAMQVADQQLRRGEHGDQAKGHRETDAGVRHRPGRAGGARRSPPPTTKAVVKKRARDHVREAVRERRIKHDVPPADRT